MGVSWGEERDASGSSRALVGACSGVGTGMVTSEVVEYGYALRLDSVAEVVVCMLCDKVLPIPYIRRIQRTTQAYDSSARPGRAQWYQYGNHRTTDCAVTRDKPEPMYSLL